MRNALQPAYQAPEHEHTRETIGLTKRELIAAMAMQGVISGFDPESKANGCYIPSSEYTELMKQCVQIADELLKQLES